VPIAASPIACIRNDRITGLTRFAWLARVHNAQASLKATPAPLNSPKG
jgi:hypothetical protein